MEPRPAWLLVQEHGALAEARTRSFLLDRFWVLERSVDIEGADFFIQQRITARSLLDRTPARLGVVQAKFFQDPATTQYVRREYVVNQRGEPRADFFVVCHTGVADAAAAYFLTADEIVSSFRESGADHSRPGCFILPGRSVLIQRFAIVDRGRCLDCMERALKDVDFRSNRAFLSWALPSVGLAPPIAAAYEEPIDNWWGDIPTGFSQLRTSIRQAQADLREVFERLVEIESTDDPVHALNLAEELDAAWGRSVPLPRELYPREFHEVVLRYKRRYDELSAAGLLGAHAALRRTGLEFVKADLAARKPLTREEVYVLTVRYDAESLLRPRFEGLCEVQAELPSPRDMPIDFHLGVRAASPGLVDAYCRFAWFIHDDPDAPWPKRVHGLCDTLVGKICSTVLDLRFGREF